MHSIKLVTCLIQLKLFCSHLISTLVGRRAFTPSDAHTQTLSSLSVYYKIMNLLNDFKLSGGCKVIRGDRCQERSSSRGVSLLLAIDIDG